MNKKIEVEFVEELPPFEVRAVDARTPENSTLAMIRRRFWLGWQLFAREGRL